MFRISFDEELVFQFVGGSDWEIGIFFKISFVEGIVVGFFGGSDWEIGIFFKISFDIDLLVQLLFFIEGNEEIYFKNSFKDEMVEYFGGLSDLEFGGFINLMLIQIIFVVNGEKSFLMILIFFVLRMKLILGNVVCLVCYVFLGLCGEGLFIVLRMVCGVYYRVLMLIMML